MSANKDEIAKIYGLCDTESEQVVLLKDASFYVGLIFILIFAVSLFSVWYPGTAPVLIPFCAVFTFLVLKRIRAVINTILYS